MRYLVLEKNYFKSKKKEVYFHDWCLEDNWKKINKKLLNEFEKNKGYKYHWDNKKKLKRDYKKLTKLTYKLLNEIVININKYHSTNHTFEYWKIILLPWVKSIIVLFYDRWEMINYIPKKNLIFCIYNFKRESFIPERYLDLNAQDKDLNHWIVSEIVKYKKNIKFIEKNVKVVKKFEYVQRRLLSRKPKKLSVFYKFIFKIFSKIFNCNFFIHDIGLSKFETLILNLKLLQFPFFWLDTTYKDENIDLKKRKKYFYKESQKNNFENFLRQMLYLNIPKSYLENYKNIEKEITRSYWPKNSKMILTGYSYNFNEFFKIWTAKMVAKGSKYLVLQHGGGTGLEEIAMNTELDVADKFLSWGWKNNEKKVIPFNSFALSFRKKASFKSSKKKIFICPSFQNKYSYLIYAHPLTNLDRLRKINSIKCLVDNLNKKLGDEVVLRYLKQIEEWMHYKFQENIFNKKIKYDHGNLPFNKIMPEGRLFVHTSNQTGFLETMYNNLPTILLLDKKCETFKEANKKIINLLEKNKIIHYDANVASQFINSNINHIEKWWFNKDLQKTRNFFCSQFVKEVQYPVKELKNIFNKLQ